MRIVVLGGGITGKLVHHRMPDAHVFETSGPPQSTRHLTRSFGTNYLWEPIPGLKCFDFPVVTHVDGLPPTTESVVRYKTKVDKAYEVEQLHLVSALIQEQFKSEQTGYDFAELPDTPIAYNARAVEINRLARRVVFSNGRVIPYDYLISTIPLYALAELITPRLTEFDDLGGRTAFKYDPILVRIVQRPPDAPYPDSTLYVNYLSDPNVVAYRYCDRYGERHYESIKPMTLMPNRKLVPGKIHPLAVGPLLYRMSRYGIETVGRYASWEPNELVHLTWRRIDALATLWGL
jgi:hypothetical protein